MIRSHQYRSDYYGGLCTYKWHLTPCGKPREDHEEVDYVTKENDIQAGRKAFLLVVVDLDPVPGTMHTEESAKDIVRNILYQRIPHYNPIVTYADIPANAQPDDVEDKELSQK